MIAAFAGNKIANPVAHPDQPVAIANRPATPADAHPTGPAGVPMDVDQPIEPVPVAPVVANGSIAQPEVSTSGSVKDVREE